MVVSRRRITRVMLWGGSLWLLARVAAPGGAPAREALAAGTDIVVSGVVQDTGGHPLAGATMVVSSDAATGEISVLTNAGGTYHTIVPVGHSLTVQAILSPYRAVRQRFTFRGVLPPALTVNFSGRHALMPLPALTLVSPTGLFVVAGTAIVVAGHGYLPGTVVVVALGHSGATRQARADGSGAFVVTLIVPHAITGGAYTLFSVPASATRPTLLVRARPVGLTGSAFCMTPPARGRISWAGDAARTPPLLHLVVGGLPPATPLGLYVDAAGAPGRPYEVAPVQSDHHGGVMVTIRAWRPISSAVRLLFESSTGKAGVVRATARPC